VPLQIWRTDLRGLKKPLELEALPSWEAATSADFGFDDRFLAFWATFGLGDACTEVFAISSSMTTDSASAAGGESL
jgi:hypothetical protein